MIDLGRKVQSAQRHAEQEPQPGHDAVTVADARTRLGQVQLEAADVLKCGPISWRLSAHRALGDPLAMGTKSRETIYGASDPGGGRASDRKPARKPIGSPSRRGTSACSPFRVRAQPSPTLGDAINTGFDYLEVNALAAPSIRPLPSTPRAATEDNAGPLTETLHAMQGLLAGSRNAATRAVSRSDGCRLTRASAPRPAFA